ncbi:hypothetical protein JCM8202v2_005494 [Rhodotorula sphaerocarpa]
MSTHDGWIDGFPFLRIDNFSNQQHPESGRFPLHYLLTHAHSDHLTGLDAKGFSGKLYMTDVTKQFVLEWMEAQERVRYAELGQRINPAYKFENLKRGRGRGRSLADQIVKVSYNQPFQLPGSDGNPAVTVTAIDANHCPGSCMYLLESICGARSVLVTGDIRIDADYLEVLRRNPALGPYTAYAPPASRPGSSNQAAASTAPPSGKGLGGSADERPAKRKRVAVKTLDRIYLDTSQVLLDEELVTKENAVADFLSLLDLYPPDTLFYLNAWTWGYEELLKGVYKAYGEKIHLDWHKGCQYSSPAMRASDPLLAELGAPDPHPAVVDSAVSAGWKRFRGRFHACERRWKCDQVWQDGVGCYCWEEEYVPELKGVKTLRRPGSGERLPGDEGAVVVNVNPAEMPAWMWREYFEEKKAQLETCSGVQAEHADGGKDPSRGRWPTSLVIPLARHSALPELRSLVSLLQPRSVFPLTCTHPSTYQSLPSIFDGHLAPGGTERLQREALQYVAAWAEKRAAAAAYAQLAALVGGAPADGAEAAEGLIEPDALSELSKKGINVEGGEAVVEEVLALMEKARKGRAKRYGQVERRAATTSTSRSSPSVSTQPPGAPKRSSAAVEVITLTDSEESQSLHEFPPSKRRVRLRNWDEPRGRPTTLALPGRRRTLSAPPTVAYPSWHIALDTFVHVERDRHQTQQGRAGRELRARHSITDPE